VIEEAIGGPRGRTIGLPYLRTFIEEMKTMGFIAKALESNDQPDAIAAPRAGN
jgi:hypothetical protein